MQGFVDLVDSLGGVTVTVENPVPIHTDDTFTEVAEYIGPGVVTLDGYHALWYARSRHETTDYDRMARQRQLMEAILEQSTPANVLSKFQAVASAGVRLIRTDIPQSALGFFVDLAIQEPGAADHRPRARACERRRPGRSRLRLRPRDRRRGHRAAAGRRGLASPRQVGTIATFRNATYPPW